MEFQGTALAMSSQGIAAATSRLQVAAAEVWTVFAVETSGCGFLPDRRPQILFERHVFHRLTGGQYDDGDISDPHPGGYGARGSNQYERLARAIVKDRGAALQSASWGLGQIMGENFAAAGFADVDEMVAAMCASEDNHVAALASFLVATGLRRALQAHDWVSFARGYNGPNFGVNQYDRRLADAYLHYSSANLPDLDVRAAQLYLRYLGFSPGPVDGIAGFHTQNALDACVAQYQLSPASAITADVVTSLLALVAGGQTQATAGSQS